MKAAPIVPSSPHVMNTYGRLPIALTHGKGCRVWDVNGKEYLDALAGIGVAGRCRGGRHKRPRSYLRGRANGYGYRGVKQPATQDGRGLWGRRRIHLKVF